MEMDGVDEVPFVPESAGGVLHPLNLRIQGFAGRIRDAVAQVGHDVLEPPLQHPPHFDHWLQPAARRPTAPPAEMPPRRPLVAVVEKRPHRFL